MRGIRAKSLMGLTRAERAGEKDIVERELVQKRSGSVVHGPNTIRAMYLRLKAQFKFVSTFDRSAAELKIALQKLTGEFKEKVQRVRERVMAKPKRNTVKPQGRQVIESPLMLILQHCQPEIKKDPLTGETYGIPHPLYRRARLLADRGDGAAVRRIAAQFA